jgi:hypothetical protein
MDNHHVSWVNQLFLWPFSIAFCMCTRPGKWFSPKFGGQVLFPMDGLDTGAIPPSVPSVPTSADLTVPGAGQLVILNGCGSKWKT